VKATPKHEPLVFITEIDLGSRRHRKLLQQATWMNPEDRARLLAMPPQVVTLVVPNPLARRG
jgi:hypothetical protein